MISSRRRAFRWYHDNYMNRKVKLAASLGTILLVLITTAVILALPGLPRSFALVVDSGDCGLVVEASDEFVDTGNLNPGDSKSSYLVAINTKATALNYYFDLQITHSVAGEYPGLEGRHLEEVLVIAIRVDGELVFEGLLTEFAEMDMGLLLGYENQRIDVSVYFPGESGNQFQAASVSVLFMFRSECSSVSYYDETAYAKGDEALCFIPVFSQWGWTNPILPGEYEWELWAGAAGCDTEKGILVGSVNVIYDAEGYVTVNYHLDAPYMLKETHVYAGTTKFPQTQQGRRSVSTVAPGLYYNDSPFDGQEIFVIVHAVVGIPDSTN